MKLNTSLANKQQPQSFSTFINSDKVKRGIIERLGGDVQLATRLIATITAIVNGNEKLQECDYGSIVTSVLHGEVGMNLSLALGQYGVIPYGKIATYQLQVNGLKQLCIRSKAYSKIDVYDVREGEFVGRDPMTREPIFKWIEDEDKRLELPICGYYAFYKLSEDYNYFFRCTYWSHEKILKHADRYSQAFSLEKYRKLLAGELEPEEVEKLQGTKRRKGSSPWYANPNDDAHIKMCKKTVMKELLNDGLAPKSIQEVIAEDNYIESHETAMYHDGDTFFSADAATGEVIESTAVVSDADISPVTDDASEPKKNTRGAKSSDSGKKNGVSDDSNVEYENTFFGG